MEKAKPIPESISSAGLTSPAREEASAAFEHLYQENLEPVYYFLLSRVRNVADAEDLTSQTFLSAYQSQDRVRDRQKFRAWLFTIARNKSIDFFRKRSRQPQQTLTDADLPYAETPTPGQQDQLIHLASLLSTLNSQDQELLQLRLVAGLTFGELARVLRRSEASIKKHYYRILSRLQSQAEEK